MIKGKFLEEQFLTENYGKIPPVPFSECLMNYARVHEREHPKSFRKSTYYRLKILLKYFESVMAHEIDGKAIREFMTARYAVVKPATIQKDTSTLRAILNMAFNDGLLDERPNVPKLKKLPGKTRWLTSSEVRRLCSAVSARGAHIKPLIQMAYETGGRLGELLALDWREVNMKNGHLTFVHTKNGDSRTIRLSQTAIAELMSLGPKTGGPVFIYRGKPFSSVKASFGSACKSAGLTDVTFHTLRHSFASRLVQAGVPLYDVMKMTGHKSLEMVQRYAHLSPDYQTRALEVLNGSGHNMGTVPATVEVSHTERTSNSL